MKIALVTLNSTYQHSSFGLRYLKANLRELEGECRIFEYTIQKPANLIAKEVLESNPSIIGFGVYIWNTSQTLKVIKEIRTINPSVLIVLGGPEVSYESESQEICQISDYVIKGEADFSFYQFCSDILLNNTKPTQKFISSSLPDITKIRLPYYLYTDDDIKNRTVYVEASRGCPYKCEYCLSSLDKSVRNFPIEAFLDELQVLINRGTRQFKFIDRTFNLSPTISAAILNFFLKQMDLGLFLHFEMVPDRLPDELKNLIVQFPAGSLQFEIGIQTLNPTVANLVSRKNDLAKVEQNLKFLAEQTTVHTHVDLIAGLPSETLESFAKGFDQVAKWNPSEVQLGILKRLKGTPIIRHDREFQMNYGSEQPFQISSTSTMSAPVITQVYVMSRFWDMVANSGNFTLTFNYIKAQLELGPRSLFFWFLDLSNYLHQRFQRTHKIHLLNLYQEVFQFTTESDLFDKQQITNLLAADYQSGQRSDLPGFLKASNLGNRTINPDLLAANIPKRQKQHLRIDE